MIKKSILILRQMAEYANKNGADAAIWAAFPSNASWEDIRKELEDNFKFRIKTVEYLETLPEPKTKLEKILINAAISPYGLPLLRGWYD